MKRNSGISLIEILVVMGVFAVLGILTTRSVILSLQGSKKGDALVKVRENVNYAMAVMERQLRNAEEITACTSSSILYKDSLGGDSSFSCSGGYIASGSARLTSSEVVITACSFICTPSTPPQIDINIAAEGISATTKVDLRTY
jgi:type II secretory pathway pseudopilin PulG